MSDHPHQETAAVLAVLHTLACADDAQLLTAEVASRCGWTPDQVDSARRILAELEAAGWVTRHGSARTCRWTLGFGLEVAAYHGRQSLAGRAPSLTALPATDRYAHHTTAAATVDLLRSLTSTPLALSTTQCVGGARVSVGVGRRMLGALALADWVRLIPRADGSDSWRPSDALHSTARRRTSYWRTVSSALNRHLSLVD